jgi:hypothetical protein
MALMAAFTSSLAACGRPSSCAGPGNRGEWCAFHADGPNQGFILAHTYLGRMSPRWVVQVGPVGMNSPVEFGRTDFIGNLNGEFYHINEGQCFTDPNCASKVTPAPGEMISGSPGTATSPLGQESRACVVTTRNPDTRPASTLHCYDAFANGVDPLRLLWSYGIDGWTTSSPKIWWGEAGPYVFLFGSSNPASKLYVIREGRLVTTADVCGNVVVGASRVKPPAGKKLPLLPTVAVIDIPSFTPANEPTLVIADHCGVAAFRFTNERLNKLWLTTFDNDQDNVTSTAVAGGVVAVGRSDHQLIVYSLRDGSEQFRYDAGEPIVATPSIFGIEIHVASLKTLHVVDFNGNLLRSAFLPGVTTASPVLSLDGIYVSTAGGFVSYSTDLLTQIVDKGFQGGGSSPAIAIGGILAVTADGNLTFLGPPGGD